MGDGVNASSINVGAGLGLIYNTIWGNARPQWTTYPRVTGHSRHMALLPFAAVISGIDALVSIAVEVAAQIREMQEEHE